MLWEVVIRPTEDQPDREAERVLQEAQNFQAASIRDLQSARSFLIQTSESQAAVERVAVRLLVDSVVETWDVQPVAANGQQRATAGSERTRAINVLFKPGVTDNVGQSTKSRADRPGPACRRGGHLPQVLGQRRRGRVRSAQAGRPGAGERRDRARRLGPAASGKTLAGQRVPIRAGDRAAAGDGRCGADRAQPPGAALLEPPRDADDPRPLRRRKARPHRRRAGDDRPDLERTLLAQDARRSRALSGRNPRAAV